MGCLFAGKLSGVSTDAEVAILTHWDDQADAIRANGVLIEEDGAVERYRPMVITSVNLPWTP